MHRKETTSLFRWTSFPLTLAFLLAISVTVVSADDISSTKGIRKTVTVEGTREHQAAFQAIADANGDVRALGTPGYDASAQYVYDRMTAAGYDVRYQDFEVYTGVPAAMPALEQTSPDAVTYEAMIDFWVGELSGSGDVTEELFAVDLNVPSLEANSSTSGCEVEDFAGFPAGRIALLQRGTCAFGTKVANAEAAGAGAVIIFNEGDSPGRAGLFNMLLFSYEGTVPVISTTFDIGNQLRNGAVHGPTGTTVHVETDVPHRWVPTRNVVAETPYGGPDQVVVGAHLDSVPLGPGIQDNGSGSAVVLEIAEEYAAQMRDHRNKVVFVWFGAEEQGLFGSEHFVNSLSPEEVENTLAMINLDMVGSPNYVRFVYDGDNSTFGPDLSEIAPPGSGYIERLFVDYFSSQGMATEPTPFDGQSDYLLFMYAGIPVGGLYTGALETKTEAQAATYGGTAGEALDPCYHQACDTYANISLEALDQMSDAAAHAVVLLAKHKGDLPVDPDASTEAATKRASDVAREHFTH